MERLQYDSLYKFLVSLGIVLITLPIVTLVYVLTSNPILISKAEFDALSEYSKRIITYRDFLAAHFFNCFFRVCVGSMLIGFIAIGFGIYKWTFVQKNLDKKLDAEATMQTLSLMEMSNKEVEAKVEKEVIEEISAETIDKINITGLHPSSRQVRKYKEIEKLCYNYFTARYSKKYTFKQNIRMGKYEYDLIGVSHHSNIDLIIDIKYWVCLSNISERLQSFLYMFYDAGRNYEAIAHRNFRLLVVIFTLKEQLPQLEDIVETCIEQFKGEIKIKCLAEADLK